MTFSLRILEEEPASDFFLESYDTAIDNALDALRLHGAGAIRIKAATKRAHQRLVEKGVESISLKRNPAYAVFDALLRRGA